LGKEEDLVLHGGGNTSVKIKEKNIFGEAEDILYVKGSGWDLATIEAAGFAPVKLSVLQKLASLETLSDMEMVKNQRMAMTNPSAPNPSVEAILHAIIPFTFVDHTHADAVVTLTNTAGGEEKIREIYGDSVLIIPYVMPGFVLAKKIYDMTRGFDWKSIKGMILLSHGVFTFHDDPKTSYENMINIVCKAEAYLEDHNVKSIKKQKGDRPEALEIAKIRKQVSEIWEMPVLSQLDRTGASVAYSNLSNVESISTRGPLTPDHIIRTKRTPVILSEDIKNNLSNYVRAYRNYFNEFSSGDQVQLDPAPRWAIWPGKGTLSFGPDVKSLKIIEDITRHTKKAIYLAEQLGGWRTLSKSDLFDMEYWSLEQAKLKKAGHSKPMQGKIGLVTGAASGIGKACVQQMVAEGAVVAALDINPDIVNCFDQHEVLGIQCDVTEPAQLQDALRQTVTRFGGLDLVISNAGIFPKSTSIAKMDSQLWQKSMDVNMTSHQMLIQFCLPFLELGFDPSIVIIGSKNVHAPGSGASAYSVAKAGLTQLGRVAALELGSKKIRVNMLHPNAVFDTGLWNDEILEARAQHYGCTVEEYKTNNVLKVEVTSDDVARLAITILGKTFAKVTGAQIPVDGGNDRII
jgi:rhamnose utilization protein RhaD (predicted bifunctional aldolase and dehydrogenase)/NAD(P)-dependent dehydrogenase (short-subunit alcohol dehydrogenase family)